MGKKQMKFKRLPAESLEGIRLLQPSEFKNQEAENSDTGMFVDLGKQRLDIFVEITFNVPGKSGPYKAQGQLEWLNSGAASDQPKGLGIRLMRVFSSAEAQAGVGSASLSSVLPASGSGAPASASKAIPTPHTPAAASAQASEPGEATPPPAEPVKQPEVPIPDAKVVSELLAGLLGSEVPVTVCDAKPFVHPEKSMIGVMEDDAGKVLALWHCDLPFILNAGGALTMVPNEEVQQALKNRQVPTNLLDNWKEIVNVGSSLFNSGAKHLRLRGMHSASDPVPEEWKELFQKPAARLDVSCEFSGYGEGRMAVLVA